MGVSILIYIMVFYIYEGQTVVIDDVECRQRNLDNRTRQTGQSAQANGILTVQ